jgi:hypothetical protein
MEERHIWEEMVNIARNQPLFAGDTISHATANECVRRGWAARDEQARFILCIHGGIVEYVSALTAKLAEAEAALEKERERVDKADAYADSLSRVCDDSGLPDAEFLDGRSTRVASVEERIRMAGGDLTAALARLAHYEPTEGCEEAWNEYVSLRKQIRQSTDEEEKGHLMARAMEVARPFNFDSLELLECKGRIAELEKELADQTKAANHWFQEANREHNDRIREDARVERAADTKRLDWLLSFASVEDVGDESFVPGVVFRIEDAESELLGLSLGWTPRQFIDAAMARSAATIPPAAEGGD